MKEEQFTEWFEGSKAIDEAGEALVLYHGCCGRLNRWHTPSYFAADREVAEDFAESGVPNVKQNARTFVRAVVLQVRNPLDARTREGSRELLEIAGEIEGLILWSDIWADDAEPTDKGWDFDCPVLAEKYERDANDMSALLRIPEVRELLSQKGYDGVILTEAYTNIGVDTWVPLREEQILLRDHKPLRAQSLVNEERLAPTRIQVCVEDGPKICVAKTKYRDNEWGLSYASTDLGQFSNEEEALNCARAVVLNCNSFNILDLRNAVKGHLASLQDESKSEFSP